jgi:hypothetical protein
MGYPHHVVARSPPNQVIKRQPARQYFDLRIGGAVDNVPGARWTDHGFRNVRLETSASALARQLVHLRPQALSTCSTTRPDTWVPRSDALVLGGTFEEVLPLLT